MFDILNLSDSLQQQLHKMPKAEHPRIKQHHCADAVRTFDHCKFWHPRHASTVTLHTALLQNKHRH